MADAGSVAMIRSVCPLVIAANDCLVRKIGNGHTKPRTSSSLSMESFAFKGFVDKACSAMGAHNQAFHFLAR